MKRVIVGGMLLWIVAPNAVAQTGDPARPALAGAPSPDIGTLAAGWTALSTGRLADAETSADVLLRAGHSRHDATDLKIRARLGMSGATSALDAYETWQRENGREDVFLIQPIARRVLEDLASSRETGIAIDALEALAANGSADASARLTELASLPSTGSVADEALARRGDANAVARLEKALGQADPRSDVSGLIDALATAKATAAAGFIAAALDPSRPIPTRLAAARALGQLDALDQITILRGALEDPDPAVRFMAAAALARLGDFSAGTLLTQIENSPVADVRLMTAEISAPTNPSGPWTLAAKDSLNDPDPLTRLNAARLLLTYATDSADARNVLVAALADPNPAVRGAGARILDQLPPAIVGTDIAQLRRLLRDATPQVRLAGANALLRQAGGIE